MQEWVNYMSKSYIDLVGPALKVFKMDKVETQLDELYGESKTGRIYLPPFEIRALYDNNKWVGFLDTGGYSEKEEPMTVFLNFNNMVELVTDLKKIHVANLYIKHVGNGVPKIEKVNDTLNLYINGTLSLSFDLTDNLFSTIRKLASRIEAYPDWSVRIEGKNDLSINLIDFNKISFIQREIMIYSLDNTYKNITDVIELGDVIMTDRYRLYEVTEAKPAGDFGWNYALWQLGLEVLSVDRLQLPGNYIEQIKANTHGLSKINME